MPCGRASEVLSKGIREGSMEAYFRPKPIVGSSNAGRDVGPAARDQRGFGQGSPFAFFESKDGDLVFRPINVHPKLTLLEHLRKFQGVSIPDRSVRCPPRL